MTSKTTPHLSVNNLEPGQVCWEALYRQAHQQFSYKPCEMGTVTSLLLRPTNVKNLTQICVANKRSQGPRVSFDFIVFATIYDTSQHKYLCFTQHLIHLGGKNHRTVVSK